MFAHGTIRFERCGTLTIALAVLPAQEVLVGPSVRAVHQDLEPLSERSKHRSLSLHDLSWRIQSSGPEFSISMAMSHGLFSNQY